MHTSEIKAVSNIEKQYQSLKGENEVVPLKGGELRGIFDESWE